MGWKIVSSVATFFAIVNVFGFCKRFWNNIQQNVELMTRFGVNWINFFILFQSTQNRRWRCWAEGSGCCFEGFSFWCWSSKLVALWTARYDIDFRCVFNQFSFLWFSINLFLKKKIPEFPLYFPKVRVRRQRFWQPLDSYSVTFTKTVYWNWMHLINVVSM